MVLRLSLYQGSSEPLPQPPPLRGKGAERHPAPRDVLEGRGGGGFGWDTPPPRVPLGTEGAEENFLAVSLKHGKGRRRGGGVTPRPRDALEGGEVPPSTSRAPSLCPATAPLTPSASLNGSCNDSNRPQPLWQLPPTACRTAPGAASEAPSLPMHPCPPPLLLRCAAVLIHHCPRGCKRST